MKNSAKFVVGQKVYDPFHRPFEEGVVEQISTFSKEYHVKFNDSVLGSSIYSFKDKDKELFPFPCELDSEGYVVPIENFRQFELTSISQRYEYENYKKVTLYRIRATRDIKDHGVKKGDLGGWIEKEENMPGYNSWIADEAKVFGNAKIKRNALVSGNSIVCGWAIIDENAKICENSMVYHSARVSGNAVISGEAKVKEKATVRGNAKVYGKSKIDDNALVDDNTEIFGNAWIFGYSKITESSKVFEDAEVKELSLVYGNAKVSGLSRLSGCCVVNSDAEVTGRTKLSGNAYVTGNAIVKGGEFSAEEVIGTDALIARTWDVIYLSGFIVDKYLTFYKTKEDKIMVNYREGRILLRDLDCDKISAEFLTSKETLKSLKKLIKVRMNTPQLSKEERFIQMFRQYHKGLGIEYK